MFEKALAESCGKPQVAAAPPCEGVDCIGEVLTESCHKGLLPPPCVQQVASGPIGV